MKRITAVAAVIALAMSLVWAAEQAAGWLGFTQQEPAAGEVDDPARADADADAGPDHGQAPPEGEETSASASAEKDEQHRTSGAGQAPAEGAEASGPGDTPEPGPGAEISSIEEDLARIEEALQSEEVLEEFTPNEPLSADVAVEWPTDI